MNGLLIEGGGLRGFYSAGILKVFTDNKIEFPTLVGISSGAIFALAYELNMDMDSLGLNSIFDNKGSSFVQWKNLFRPRKGLLDSDRFFQAIPSVYDEVKKSDLKGHYITATNTQTAELEWWELDKMHSPEDMRAKVKASCTIPVVMPQSYVDGTHFVDGGIIESIPIQQMLDLGVTKPVLILTRSEGYIKNAQHMGVYLNTWLKGYDKLKEAMKTRHIRYNKALELVNKLEAEGKVFVFRPEEHRLARFELNNEKAQLAYQDGIEMAEKRLDDLLEFLNT